MPPRPANTYSPYRIGIRFVFQRPACITEAKSIFSASRSCVAPTRIECPLTCATLSAGILIHAATRLNAWAIASTLSRSPILPLPSASVVAVPRPITRLNAAPSLISAACFHPDGIFNAFRVLWAAPFVHSFAFRRCKIAVLSFHRLILWTSTFSLHVGHTGSCRSRQDLETWRPIPQRTQYIGNC